MPAAGAASETRREVDISDPTSTQLPPEPAPPQNVSSTVRGPDQVSAIKPEDLSNPPGPLLSGDAVNGETVPLSVVPFPDGAATVNGVTTAALTRRHVCATDLTVRYCPVGASFGYLLRDNTFDVDHYSGRWAYGFAWGCINDWGWIDSCYLYGGAPGGPMCCG